MIPVWLKIRIEESPHKRFRLSLPLPVIYLILLPFALPLLLVGGVICALRGVNPLRIIYVAFVLLNSVSGTHVEVQQANSSFLISIV
jgi:hypothetical protein